MELFEISMVKNKNILSKKDINSTLDKVLPGGKVEGILELQPNRQLHFTRLSMEGLEEMHEYSKDERLYKYFEFKPFKKLQETKKYLRRLINLEGIGSSERTSIGWFIRRISDNHLVGTARLTNLNYDRRSVEWGYGIDPNFWGDGYIFEIQEILKEYIFTDLGLNRLYGTTMMDNNRTKSALIATGCRQEGILRQFYRDYQGKYHDGWSYSLLAKDYFTKENQIPIKSDSPKYTKLAITKMIAEELKINMVSENGDMNSIGAWDSLTHISIILAIEKQTGFKFLPAEIAQSNSIQNIYNILNK